jgi:hypothetical protein
MLVHQSNRISVPIGGNSWLSGHGLITNNGVEYWVDNKTIISTYVRFEQSGVIFISLVIGLSTGKSLVRVNIEGHSYNIETEGLSNQESKVYMSYISSPGYVRIDIQGISRLGHTFGVLKEIGISGPAVTSDMAFIRDNIDDSYLYGRRGPSVHLWYRLPEVKIEWFYSEINVPVNNDVVGSFFMANGFANGYFGMLVNSPSERKVLFSVWSPFKTDNPTSIPEDQKVIHIRKGNGVLIGEFGNEGSGGQSSLIFNWRAETTYRFLVQAKPNENNNTIYTAYFFAPEEGTWRLIASFKRPYTNTHLMSLYSFLENFNPEHGNITRNAMYQNQWICDTNGNWYELTQAKLTADDTARKNFRKDYAGGVISNKFYLRNCGFFNDFVDLDVSYQRTSTNNRPNVNFLELP